MEELKVMKRTQKQHINKLIEYAQMYSSLNKLKITILVKLLYSVLKIYLHPKQLRKRVKIISQVK